MEVSMGQRDLVLEGGKQETVQPEKKAISLEKKIDKTLGKALAGEMSKQVKAHKQGGSQSPKNSKLNSMKKKFSTGEEISHAITHGIGTLLGIAALVLLMVKGGTSRNALYVVSMAIYGTTLILLYNNSTIYHALTHKKAKLVFEKLDHLSIYMLIAGTYTPYMLVAVGGVKGIVICSIQWSLAIVGIVMKAIWIERYQKLHLVIYLAMGWMIVMLFGDVQAALTVGGTRLLILGGVSYSIGVLFYVFRWFKYHHMIWHLFVLGGSVLHFFSIYLYI